MEKKIVKKLSDDALKIKVMGQSDACSSDCKQWKEVSGQTVLVHVAFTVCNVWARKCTGYYYYDAFWTERF